MKTKKLWILALTFGTIATLVVYFGLVSNLSASTNPEEEVKTEEIEEVESVVNEPVKREMENPMLEVSKGKRAISLQVLNLPQGVSGYVEPESYVDIIAYGTERKEDEEDKEKEKEFRSAVLTLQKIKVLGTGKSADNAEEALHYETVTVEVTPEEGVMLSLAAKDVDGFYFMLRNPEDDSVEDAVIQETREVFKEGGS